MNIEIYTGKAIPYYLSGDYKQAFKEVYLYYQRRRSHHSAYVLKEKILAPMFQGKLDFKVPLLFDWYGGIDEEYDILCRHNNRFKDIKNDFKKDYEIALKSKYANLHELYSKYYKNIYWKPTGSKWIQNSIELYPKKKYFKNIDDELRYNKKFNIGYWEKRKDERLSKDQLFWIADDWIKYELTKIYSDVIDYYAEAGRIEKIIPKWKTQFLLFENLKAHFKNEVIVSEGSPDFLISQRFDIWFPKRYIAVEYNGRQHYEPIDFFGGEEGFRKTVANDKLKAQKCIDNNVKLIVVKRGFSLKQLIYTIEDLINKA